MLKLLLAHAVDQLDLMACLASTTRSISTIAYTVVHRRCRLPQGNGDDCPGGKTPHGSPLSEGSDQPYDIELVFFVQKISQHLFLGKSTKTAATRAAHFQTPICTTSFGAYVDTKKKK